MAIRRSLAAEISQLISQLAAVEAVDRDSAVARLAVIGARAGDPLVAAVRNTAAPAVTRAAALRALSAMNAAHAIDLAIEGLQNPSDTPLAAEALEIVRNASLGRGTGATAAFEQLTELALNRAAPATLRVSAFEALQAHPAEIVAPLVATLSQDPDGTVAAAARRSIDGTASVSLDTAMDGTPEAAANVITQASSDASPAELLRALEAARSRENRNPKVAEAWRLVRAQLHEALAGRNSQIAVYDLREAFEAAARPLPMGFVVAITHVGDRSCLEPLARAWRLAVAQKDTSWRNQIARAFVAIAERERIGRQSAAVKKIVARWPDTAALVAGANTTSRTRPSQPRERRT